MIVALLVETLCVAAHGWQILEAEIRYDEVEDAIIGVDLIVRETARDT